VGVCDIEAGTQGNPLANKHIFHHLQLWLIFDIAFKTRSIQNGGRMLPFQKMI
jgi:hypothetical protein